MCADCDDAVGAFGSGANRARIFHRVGERLFDVGVAPGAKRFNALRRVLKIRRRDDHRLHIFVFVEFFVVARKSDLAAAGQLRHKRAAIFAAFRPNVGQRDELKIELARRFQERRREAVLESIGKSDDADADAIVRARDFRVARCRRAQRRSRHPAPASLRKLRRDALPLATKTSGDRMP